MASKNQFRTTVVVDGKSIGAFNDRTGGDTDSDLNKRITVDGVRIYNGRPTVNDVTVTRDYDRERDVELLRTLEQRAGKAPMSVTEQPLDDDGNPWGKPKVWTGKLKSVNTGEANAAGADPRDYTLVMMCDAVH
ncbi:hypothetical protein Back2_17890 [Nocardioides baekrokdamisoli]|uniref:Tail tube protein n=1 Tax=Nocardioides baekrokdamisoli TaxID=1804624 RepID=A0A3G9IH27_9ACTN|nr:hypothetical protein [Nocardioides baekrokdamisoli]BBH17502.1 hypothetical protein Back2_17890 [Nocardioides baekrokdamisoli]